MDWRRFLPLRCRPAGKTIHVAVLGNCQARPIATLLPLYNPAITVTCVDVVHLLRDEDAPQYAQALRQADVILAQHVADTYPCSFVRNSELVRQYGHKVIFWINLYFRGYNPELFIPAPG